LIEFLPMQELRKAAQIFSEYGDPDAARRTLELHDQLARRGGLKEQITRETDPEKIQRFLEERFTITRSAKIIYQGSGALTNFSRLLHEDRFEGLEPQQDEVDSRIHYLTGAQLLTLATIKSIRSGETHHLVAKYGSSQPISKERPRIPD
jgi:hypothetical protein